MKKLSWGTDWWLPEIRWRVGDMGEGSQRQIENKYGALLNNTSDWFTII